MMKSSLYDRVASPSEVAKAYSIVRTNPKEGTTYLNLGYWRDHPPNHRSAAAAMAKLLAEEAGYQPGDVILDAGFGFGDQDIDWVRDYHPSRIVGINICEYQTEQARLLAIASGLEGAIDFRVGNAVKMEFPDASFDKVVALESAFHFPTREDFFREAFRVLKPGGCLATADVTVLPSADPWERWGSERALAMMKTPEANRYSRQEYIRTLERSGFESIQIRSIREHVFSPFYRYFAERLRQDFTGALPSPIEPERFWRLDESGDDYRKSYLKHAAPAAIFGFLLANKATGPFALQILDKHSPDYIIARAVKPRKPPRESQERA